MTKYTVKKAYGSDTMGRIRVIWNIMYGEEVIDTCNLRRDAKHWCDKWNQQLAEDTATGV